MRTFASRWLTATAVFAACGTTYAETATYAGQRGTATPQVYVPVELAAPPAPSAEQLARFAEWAKRPRGAGRIMVSSEPVLGPTAGTDVAGVSNLIAARFDESGVEPNASAPPAVPGTFKIFDNRIPVPSLGTPPLVASEISEPSHANSGKFVFYVGNWFAALSKNKGGTWTYVNPYADYPDFCCDQDVIYDKARDLMVWYRQGARNGAGTNTFKISRSTNGGVAWTTYTLSLTNYGFPTGWFDYPHLALTQDYLYITSNYFNPNLTFNRMVLTRIPLDELLAGGVINFNFWWRTTGYTWTPIQGARDVMFLGDHTSTTLFNVCRQSEANAALNCQDIAVPAWTATPRGSAVCPTPNGRNPCARLDQRVTGGWLKEDETTNQHNVGFFWTVAQGAGFLYPYVNGVQFDANTLAVLAGLPGRPFIWNNSNAFVYGAAAPNERGHLDMGCWLVGGGNYAILTAGIDDDFNAQAPGWEISFVASGNNHVGDTWGDYLRVRAHNPDDNVWSISGHVTRGAVQEQHYATFGRERDEDGYKRFYKR